MFHNIFLKIAGRPFKRTKSVFFLFSGNFLLLEEQKGNLTPILIYFPWKNKVRNRHSMHNILPVFCQFMLSVENRLAHKIWNGYCIPLLTRFISPSRRELGWALAWSVISLGAQKGLKPTLLMRNGERGSERGRDTHWLQLQSWGSTHIPHPGSSSRNRFLIHTKAGGNVVLSKAALGM